MSAIAILEKLPFIKGNKKYFASHGSNNIFADCTVYIYLYLKDWRAGDISITLDPKASLSMNGGWNCKAFSG